MNFPVEHLVPLPGTLSGLRGDINIAIPLRAFELLLDGETITVETRLRLEAVSLPSDDFPALAGKTFLFPKNPADGYVDASMYIHHAHHPVDVTALRFGAVSLAGIAVEVDATINVEFEGLGAFSNAHWSLSAVLRHR